MPTTMIGITDTHWTERRPASRTDPNWIETQTRKLEFIFELAREVVVDGVKGAHAIVHAGDLFHQPDGKLISRRVDSWLISMLRQSPCPIYAIPGNHDMKMDRMDSLSDHPYASLTATNLIQQMVWPQYTVIGDDPPVILTGKEYLSKGFSNWLEEIRSTQIVQQMKAEISQEFQKPVFALVLLHGWFSENGGLQFGEQSTKFSDIYQTGFDCAFIGHDHSITGINPVQEDNNFSYVIGPGALTRGTISEQDTARVPKCAILSWQTDGEHHFSLETVPHEPAHQVFDFATHGREKRQKRDQLVFIDECKKIQTTVPTIEIYLNKAIEEQLVSPQAVVLTREFLTRAKDSTN